MIDDVIFDRAIKERINYRFEPKAAKPARTSHLIPGNAG